MKKHAIILNWEGERKLPEPEMPESSDSLKAESCMNKVMEWRTGCREAG